MTSADLSPNTLFGFKDKVVLVSGGGSGIGLFMARGFASAGATVYIAGRRKNVVEESAAKHGAGLAGSIVGLELDITSKESILKAVETIGSKHKKLDVLVNNAGTMGPLAPFLGSAGKDTPELASPEAFGKALFGQVEPNDWQGVFSTNVFAMYYMSTAFLGLLEAGSKADEDFSSSIVNITSINATNKNTNSNFLYHSSKAAANHITVLLGTEFARKGAKVRVNAIAPGIFPSEMTGGEGKSFDGKMTDRLTGALTFVPAQRSGKAEEIAGTALYLASKGGRYTNGVRIVVDGGYQMVNPAST